MAPLAFKTERFRGEIRKERIKKGREGKNKKQKSVSRTPSDFSFLAVYVGGKKKMGVNRKIKQLNR
jgi:hypothetical protein